MSESILLIALSIASIFVIHLFYFVLSVLYSSKEELCNSSSDFWCAILSSEKEVNLFVMFTLGIVSLIKLCLFQSLYLFIDIISYDSPHNLIYKPHSLIHKHLFNEPLIKMVI